MAQLSLQILILLFSIFCVACTVEPAVVRRSRARAFIEASCERTLYPSLCVRSLSGFANQTKQSPQLLVQIALSVSLVKAQQTRKFLLDTSSKMKGLMSGEPRDLSDCLGQINDSVDQLRQSIRELQHFGQTTMHGSDPMWHVSNVETWVSAALTDATACVEGFTGRGKLKATIKGKVLNMAQHTSNALALFNRFASRYGKGAVTEEPKA